MQEESASDSETSYQAESESYDDSEQDEHWEPETKTKKKCGRPFKYDERSNSVFIS